MVQRMIDVINKAVVIIALSANLRVRPSVSAQTQRMCPTSTLSSYLNPPTQSSSSLKLGASKYTAHQNEKAFPSLYIIQSAFTYTSIQNVGVCKIFFLQKKLYAHLLDFFILITTFTNVFMLN